MAYTPGQFQQSLTSSTYYTNTIDVVSVKNNNYNTFYSSLNTSATGRIQVKSDGTVQQGYRVDVADVKNVYKVGDDILIGGLSYTVKEVVNPVIDVNSGKFVSPILLGDQSTIDVFPATKRSYRIDVTINKGDVQ